MPFFETSDLDTAPATAAIASGVETMVDSGIADPKAVAEEADQMGELFSHVIDSDHFHVPRLLGEYWYIPNPLGGTKADPLIGTAENPIFVGQLTKYMVLEVIAAVLLCGTFIWLAKKIKSGERPQGRFWNLLEVMILFVRNDIARPSIGSKDGDRYLGFLLTLFFFVLTLNLIGMVPWAGSATGSMAVTFVLAGISFVVVIGSGIKRMGVVGFLKAQVPHMELPKAMALVLIPSIWVIEMFGLLVKHFVLGIRLFANMFAGHLVLAVFLSFIAAAAGSFAFYMVTPAVILGSIAFSLLELFVSFLQAYVFTFLTALFIGSAIHPH